MWDPVAPAARLEQNGAVTERIDGRRRRVGPGDYSDPEEVERLQERRAQHQRLLARGRAGAFDAALAGARRSGEDEDERGEPDEDEAQAAGAGETEADAKDGRAPVHLGLHPAQDIDRIRPDPKAAGKVIIKG